MPRENRRRGKRKKNDIQEDLDEKEPVKLKEPEDEGQPSWIETGHLNETSDPDAPFGLCDPDIKAYFRSVENQLKEWQDLGVEKENVSEEDSNLERRMFFSAALTEMQGKECMLATDPDCAVILERMIYSMDDLARRIFMNNLIGSVVELAKHRFGSHVLETLFELGASTVSRETQGILPTAQALPQFANQPTMSKLVAQFCKEITPTSPALVNEQFASHVLQRLITLLVPSLDFLREKKCFRSKRSAGYKSKQGSLKSVFEAAPDLPDATRKTPPEFLSLAKEILNCIKEKFSASEIRALAADQVACPTLRVSGKYDSLPLISYAQNRSLLHWNRPWA
ncbi:Nucleolar protein 9 [Serendipita sp. 411]|nr:Nucleolar protein 9 [Serendipita sp. 411]